MKIVYYVPSHSQEDMDKFLEWAFPIEAERPNLTAEEHLEFNEENMKLLDLATRYNKNNYKNTPVIVTLRSTDFNRTLEEGLSYKEILKLELERKYPGESTEIWENQAARILLEKLWASEEKENN